MLYHNVLIPHKKNITKPWKTRQQPQTSHKPNYTSICGPGFVLSFLWWPFIVSWQELTNLLDEQRVSDALLGDHIHAGVQQLPVLEPLDPGGRGRGVDDADNLVRKQYEEKNVYFRGKYSLLTSTSSPSLVWINTCSGSISGLWRTSSWTWHNNIMNFSLWYLTLFFQYSILDVNIILARTKFITLTFAMKIFFEHVLYDRNKIFSFVLSAA